MIRHIDVMSVVILDSIFEDEFDILHSPRLVTLVALVALCSTQITPSFIPRGRYAIV